MRGCDNNSPAASERCIHRQPRTGARRISLTVWNHCTLRPFAGKVATTDEFPKQYAKLEKKHPELSTSPSPSPPHPTSSNRHHYHLPFQLSGFKVYVLIFHGWHTSKAVLRGLGFYSPPKSISNPELPQLALETSVNSDFTIQDYFQGHCELWFWHKILPLSCRPS